MKAVMRTSEEICAQSSMIETVVSVHQKLGETLVESGYHMTKPSAILNSNITSVSLHLL